MSTPIQLPHLDCHGRIIVIASEKGGVAKTTVTTNLAHAFALAGCNTLIADADPRGDASAALGLPSADSLYQFLINNQSLASQLTPTGRANLTILRGNQTTRRAINSIHTEILGGELRPEFIRTTWRNLAYEQIDSKPIDLLLIDTPPNGGFWPEQTYLAADLIVIPTSMDNLDRDAANTTHQKLQIMHNTAPVFLLPSIYNADEPLDVSSLAQLTEAFTPAFTLPPIPRSARIKRCRNLGKTIFELAPKSEPAKVINCIAKRLLTHLSMTN